MDRKQIEAVVLAVLAAVLQCEVSLETARSNTPKWDSLKQIEVIFGVEEELGIEFTEKEMATLDSVAKIVDLALAYAA